MTACCVVTVAFKTSDALVSVSRWNNSRACFPWELGLEPRPMALRWRVLSYLLPCCFLANLTSPCVPPHFCLVQRPILVARRSQTNKRGVHDVAEELVKGMTGVRIDNYHCTKSWSSIPNHAIHAMTINDIYIWRACDFALCCLHSADGVSLYLITSINVCPPSLIAEFYRAPSSLKKKKTWKS